MGTIGLPAEEKEDRNLKAGNVQIEFATLAEQNAHKGTDDMSCSFTAITRETIPIKNVAQMPVLSWKIPIHNKDTNINSEVKVWVSSIAAHVCDIPYEDFEIVLKNGAASKRDIGKKGRERLVFLPLFLIISYGKSFLASTLSEPFHSASTGGSSPPLLR